MAMTRKTRRLALIGAAGVVLFGAVGLTVWGLSGQIAYFYAPADIARKGVAPGQRIRLGGLVKTGTLKHEDGGRISFEITDNVADIQASYDKIPPDLFREGQGVIAEGTLGPDGVFVADTLLAKHDEKYMPKEVVEALKKKGVYVESPAAAKP